MIILGPPRSSRIISCYGPSLNQSPFAIDGNIVKGSTDQDKDNLGGGNYFSHQNCIKI